MKTIFTVNYNGTYGNRYELMAEATEETYSVADNTSRVAVYLYMRRTNVSSNGAWNNSQTPWTITIDGQEFSGTSSWDTRNTSDWQILGGATKVIQHNTDGSKTITISAYHNSQNTTAGVGTASGSGTFELTKIPRASTIKATDANIGSISSIYITAADTSFSHTITYKFGSQSGTVVTNPQQNPYPFTVPTSFYKEIPDSPEGIVTLTCTTYSNGQAIGTSETTFKASVNANDNKPNVDGSLIDSNQKTVDLTGSTADNVILVKYRSTAKITPSVSAKNNASIKEIRVDGIKVEGSYIEFLNVQKTSFEIIATDSRGFPNSKILTPNQVVEYIPLTLSARFYRVAATSSEVKLKYEGNYFDNTFGKEENALSLSWAYKLKKDTDYIPGGILTPTISNNKYGGEVSLGTTFDYQQQYDFIMYASDKLTSLNFPQPVQKGEPIYDYGVDGNGTNYLNVNGGLYIKNQDILNLIYPVGAVYMSTNNVNPSTLFGGSWEQIKDTFLLAAGNTYAAGSTGGKAKVSLAVENLPAHSHTGKTNLDGTHIHYSTAYGWMIDGVGNARSAVAEGSSGFGADIKIRADGSEHQHWFTTDTTGSGTAVENMPPYVAVYVWKRTA